MITGTTGSWTTGTAAIDDPERQPVFGVSLDVYGSIINQVTWGSLYYDDFQSASWPTWLEIGTTGTASITRGSGTAVFQSNAAADRAYVVTSSAVGSPAPNSGKFVVRTKGAVTGTGNVMYLLDSWDYGSQPIPTTADGGKPRQYFAAGKVWNLYGASVGSVVGTNVRVDYIAESLYDGTNCRYTVYGSLLGSQLTATAAHTFGSSFWGLLGEGRTNTGFGTLTAKYFEIYKGSAVAVGNLGSSYVAQLYGSDDSAVGSGQSSAVAGTANITPSLEYPILGYVKVFTGTAQTGSTGRYPDTGNGTFWGGDVYKYGDVAESLNDISADVMQLSGRMELDSAYSGYVPAGAVAGDMDIALASGSKYSILNSSSPFYGKRLLNRDLTVNAGFQYDGSAQTLRQFSGLSAKVEVDSEQRETSLYGVDKSELLRRKKLSWPVMHKVPSDYVIRAALAEVGISDGQVNDNETSFMCQFDNSLVSEQGEAPTAVYGIPTYTTGRWGDTNGALTSALGVGVRWSASGDHFTRGFVACWVNFTADSTDIVIGASETNLMSVALNSSNIQVLYQYAGASQQTPINEVVDLSGWHHVSVTWDNDTNGQIYLYLDGAFVVSADIPTLPGTDATYIHVNAFGIMDHLSIGCYLRTPEDIRRMYLAQSADDDQTELDPGINTIEWLWVDDRDAWNLIKDICEAEGAKFYFDAQGRAHFENRYHSLQPPHLTSQKTISYDADAMGLTLVSDQDAVINKAVVTANPLKKQAAQLVWTADSLLEIPAPRLSSGSAIGSYGTKEWWLWFNDPCTDVDTSITGTSGTTQSYFRAAAWKPASVGINRRYVDATGSVIMAGTAYSKCIRVKATNAFRENSWSYVGDPSWRGRPVVIGSADGTSVGVAGTIVPTPFFGIQAAPITNVWTSGGSQVDKIKKVTEDLESIGSYGEHAVEINNDFITDPEYAEYVSQYLVMYNRDPQPTVEGVEIMADPRLEIGDRITLQDSSGATGVNHDFWVTGIDWEMAPAYTQSLDLKYAGASNFFILDHPTNGRLDANVLAF